MLTLVAVVLALGVVTALLMRQREPPNQLDGNCLIECLRRGGGEGLDENAPMSALPKATRDACAQECALSDHEIRAKNRMERERRETRRELERQADERARRQQK